jgi:triacylglycerol lipase
MPQALGTVRKPSVALLALLCTTATACAADSDDSESSDCATAEACAQADAISNEPPPFTVGQVRAARYPIVLHHGFNASRTNSWSYYKVKEALEADGHDVTTTDVEPFNGVPVRARTLAESIDRVRTEFCRKQGARAGADLEACESTMKVNIIAHSMGGLDARYLAATLGYAPKIASITTISTPHGGSNIADVGLGLTPDGGRMRAVLDQLVACFGKTFTEDDLARNSNIRAALESLSEANAPSFNQANPDQQGVYYQSYAGVSRAIGGPRTAGEQADVLAACDGTYFGAVRRADFMAAQLAIGSFAVGRFTNVPQDGMVTVANAKWGNFRGCFPADHLDEVGQVRDDRPDVYTKFDHIAFYRVVAGDLAERGF